MVPSEEAAKTTARQVNRRGLRPIRAVFGRVIVAETNKHAVLGESDKADVTNVWLEPRTRKLEAFAVEYLTTEYTPLMPAVKHDIERLTAALGPQFDVVSRTLDDSKWVVAVDDPVHVISSYLYERGSGKVIWGNVWSWGS